MTPGRFYETIEPFKEKLYGFAFRMLGNREDTKDALQDVLLKLWKMRFEIDTGRVESLAMTIMKNVCVDRLREKKKLNGHISESPRIGDEVFIPVKNGKFSYTGKSFDIFSFVVNSTMR